MPKKQITFEKQESPESLDFTRFSGLFFMEAPPGIGPGMKVLQTSALPLGYGAVIKIGHEGFRVRSGADYGARTRHLDLGKVALYQMS